MSHIRIEACRERKAARSALRSTILEAFSGNDEAINALNGMFERNTVRMSFKKPVLPEPLCLPCVVPTDRVPKDGQSDAKHSSKDIPVAGSGKRVSGGNESTTDEVVPRTPCGPVPKHIPASECPSMFLDEGCSYEFPKVSTETVESFVMFDKFENIECSSVSESEVKIKSDESRKFAEGDGESEEESMCEGGGESMCEGGGESMCEGEGESIVEGEGESMCEGEGESMCEGEEGEMSEGYFEEVLEMLL